MGEFSDARLAHPGHRSLCCIFPPVALRPREDLSAALQLSVVRGETEWEVGSPLLLFMSVWQSVGRIWMKSRADIHRDLDRMEQ